MKRLLLCLASITLFSCSTYTHSSYKVESVLAITEAGDTIAVPIKEFEKNKYDSYTRFRYNNNWYYNNWRYDFNWQWNPWFFSYPNTFWWGNNLRYTVPNRGYRQDNSRPTKPRRRVAPTVPNRTRQQPKSYIQGPRGGRSYNNRSNNPNTTRNVQPNRPIQSRTNTGRTNSGKSRSNQ